RPEVALPALQAGRFVPPFSMGRMTWIKPSFNWMMHRSGYASKPGQEVVLGIDITREGFEWALKNAVLSTFTPSVHASPAEWKNLLTAKPVRIQWDPERDWRLQPIAGVRAIQIGLAGEAVERYVNQWIVHIEDVTSVARAVAAAAETGIPPSTLPSAAERPYPLDAATAAAICPPSTAHDIATSPSPAHLLRCGKAPPTRLTQIRCRGFGLAVLGSRSASERHARTPAIDLWERVRRPCAELQPTTCQCLDRQARNVDP